MKAKELNSAFILKFKEIKDKHDFEIKNIGIVKKFDLLF